MQIRFTYAQIRPVAKRLRSGRGSKKWVPTGIKPERWAQILAGNAAHLELSEVNVIANILGWDYLLRNIKANPKRKRTKAKGE